MSAKQFFKITVTLSSGNQAVLYLGRSNFWVTATSIGQVTIIDNLHRTASWTLAKHETLESVISRIDDAMEMAGML